MEGEAGDLVGFAGAAEDEDGGSLVGEVGEGGFEDEERAEFVAEDAFDEVVVEVRGCVGDGCGDGVGVEIEEGLAGCVGDAGDEAVEGGGAAEGGGGRGEDDGDAGGGI